MQFVTLSLRALQEATVSSVTHCGRVVKYWTSLHSSSVINTGQIPLRYPARELALANWIA